MWCNLYIYRSSLSIRPLLARPLTKVEQARKAVDAMNEQDACFHNTVQAICDNNLSKYKSTHRGNTSDNGHIYDCYKIPQKSY